MSILYYNYLLIVYVLHYLFYQVLNLSFKMLKICLEEILDEASFILLLYMFIRSLFLLLMFVQLFNSIYIVVLTFQSPKIIGIASGGSRILRLLVLFKKYMLTMRFELWYKNIKRVLSTHPRTIGPTIWFIHWVLYVNFIQIPIDFYIDIYIS